VWVKIREITHDEARPGDPRVNGSMLVVDQVSARACAMKDCTMNHLSKQCMSIVRDNYISWVCSNLCICVREVPP